MVGRTTPQADKGLRAQATAGYSPSNVQVVSSDQCCEEPWACIRSFFCNNSRRLATSKAYLQAGYRSCFRDLSAQCPACTFSSTLKLCEILVVGVGSCMYIFCFLLKGACAEVVMQHPSYRVHYVA